MRPEYGQAIKVGLICGLVIAAIYFASGLIGMWLNSTPAMQEYMDKLVEPFKDMWRDWPNRVQPVTYTYPSGMPSPPLEYYANMVLSLAILGVEFIGLLLAGALAFRAVRRPGYTTKDAIYTGALSGAAAFLPLFIVMLILSVISTVWGPQANLLSAMLPPGLSEAFPAIALIGVGCCCLPLGLAMSAIIAAIGALAYTLLAPESSRQRHLPNP